MNSTQDGARPLAQPTIQVWRPDPSEIGSDVGVSPDMTLPEFYKICVLSSPRCARTAETTIERTWGVLRHWQQATGDPPLRQIDELTLNQFYTYLLKVGGEEGSGDRGQGTGIGQGLRRRKISPLSSATINGYLKEIERLLAAAGPKDGKRGLRLKLISEAWKFEELLPATAPPVESAFTVDEVSAMLGACSAMLTPRGAPLSPERFWTALLQLAWHTGLRCSALMLWRWDWHGGPATESDQVSDTLRVPGKTLDDGRTANPQARDKRRRFALKNALPVYLPLNSHARQILALLAIGKRTEFVLPWPNDKKWLLTNLHRLQEQAGLPPERRFGFHAFRKGHGQALPGDAATVGRSLGHAAGSDVTRRNYAPIVQADRAAAEALPAPQRADDKQRTLF